MSGAWPQSEGHGAAAKGGTRQSLRGRRRRGCLRDALSLSSSAGTDRGRRRRGDQPTASVTDRKGREVKRQLERQGMLDDEAAFGVATVGSLLPRCTTAGGVRFKGADGRRAGLTLVAQPKSGKGRASGSARALRARRQAEIGVGGDGVGLGGRGRLRLRGRCARQSQGPSQH